MFKFNRSHQESTELFENNSMENISNRMEEPEPDTEPIPQPKRTPTPTPEPVPEEVPGRQVPGREVEEPSGPWVPEPTETPDQPDQPSFPTEIPPQG